MGRALRELQVWVVDVGAFTDRHRSNHANLDELLRECAAAAWNFWGHNDREGVSQSLGTAEYVMFLAVSRPHVLAEMPKQRIHRIRDQIKAGVEPSSLTGDLLGP